MALLIFLQFFAVHHYVDSMQFPLVLPWLDQGQECALKKGDGLAKLHAKVNESKHNESYGLGSNLSLIELTVEFILSME